MTHLTLVELELIENSIEVDGILLHPEPLLPPEDGGGGQASILEDFPVEGETFPRWSGCYCCSRSLFLPLHLESPSLSSLSAVSGVNYATLGEDEVRVIVKLQRTAGRKRIWNQISLLEILYHAFSCVAAGHSHQPTGRRLFREQTKG